MNALINHIWQSTAFAIAIGLLAFTFRKNRAAVRHWLWFSASLKFFIPFAFLIGLGSSVKWKPSTENIPAAAITFAVEPLSVPVESTPSQTNPAESPTSHPSILSDLLWGAWFLGFGAISVMRLRDWRRVRQTILSSTQVDVSNFPILLNIDVRAVPRLMEPCIVGWLHPMLLMPTDITERLTTRQLKAILVHEMSHVSRRDNLFAAIHMLAEAVFWFHPLIWWIGSRLVEERERSCDEEVVRLG